MIEKIAELVFDKNEFKGQFRQNYVCRPTLI